MNYTHTGREQVILYRDPIDADSTDWVYFVYEDWLRDDETITSHAATVTNGTLVTDSVYVNLMSDQDGTDHAEVYAVQFSVDSSATEVKVTHTVSTETSGAQDLGRLNIDHTAVIPVEVL